MCDPEFGLNEDCRWNWDWRFAYASRCTCACCGCEAFRRIAADDFVAMHEPALKRVAKRYQFLGGRQIGLCADDLLSMAWAAIIKNLLRQPLDDAPTVSCAGPTAYIPPLPPQDFHALLYVTARNTMSNHRKSERSKRGREDLNEELISARDADLASEAIPDVFALKRAENWYRMLTPDNQLVIELRFAEVPAKEAARICELEVNAYRTRVSRLRAQLQRILDGDDLSSQGQ